MGRISQKALARERAPGVGLGEELPDSTRSVAGAAGAGGRRESLPLL